MVDFNSINTVAVPAGDVVKIIILEAMSYSLDTIEAYQKVAEQSHTNNVDLSIARSRLKRLFNTVGSQYKRNYGEKKWLEMRTNIERATSIQDLENQLYIISDYLDTMRLTRFDTRNSFDTTRVAEEDDEAEL